MEGSGIYQQKRGNFELKKICSTLIILSIISSIIAFPKITQAASDTTDGKNEIFYEWVESYDNLPSPSYFYDYNSSSQAREYIQFHTDDAPPDTSNEVENLANTIQSDITNPWYISNYYTNNSAMERDWDYLERAVYNIETADIAIFGGHGIDGKSLQFNRMYTDAHLTHADADFGYYDLDWVFLFTCNWLKYKNERVLPNNILGGAHSIMGYGTTMWMGEAQKATYLGHMLTGNGVTKRTVKYAWHEMNRLYPGPNTKPGNETVSIVYGATVDENDYLWDEGPVGPYPGNNPPYFWSSVTYNTLPQIY